MSLKRKNFYEDTEREVHTHDWQLSSDMSQENCNCGEIKISARELERRRLVWVGYVEAIQNSEAYKDHMEMRQAFSQRNRAKMKEIMERIESRNHWEDVVVMATPEGKNVYERQLVPNDPSKLIKKPHFPDPAYFEYTIGDILT